MIKFDYTNETQVSRCLTNVTCWLNMAVMAQSKSWLTLLTTGKLTLMWQWCKEDPLHMIHNPCRILFHLVIYTSIYTIWKFDIFVILPRERNVAIDWLSVWQDTPWQALTESKPHSLGRKAHTEIKTSPLNMVWPYKMNWLIIHSKNIWIRAAGI